MEQKTNENISRWDQFNLIMDNKTDLKAKEKLILLAIFRFYNPEKGYSYPSVKNIKEMTGITQNRDYYNYIKNLEEKGFLRKETFVGKGCRFYITMVRDDTKLQNDTMLQNDTDTKLQNDTPPSCKMTLQKEKKTKEKKIIYKDLKFIDDVIDKVEITEEQYQKLITKYSSILVNSQIENLDNYIANGKGSKYKDHYKVLNTWCKKEREKKKGSLDIIGLSQDDLQEQYIIG